MRGHGMIGQVSSAGRQPWGRRQLGAGLMVGVLLAGCTRAPAAPAGPPQGTAGGSDFPEVLATIGTDQVTMADIRARVGDDLDRIETRYQLDRHKIVDATLQDLLRERVLGAEAEKQGKSVDELILAEAGGTLEPSDVEIAAWYQENRGRVGGRTLDQIRPQIADFLRKQRREDAGRQLGDRLNAERKVTVLLEPFRLPLNNEGAPARGPGDASVTLVEFSDFQCPFCGQFFPTLKRIEENYADRVRIVYRQFPLTSIHPFAYKAAEASLCAHDQGKFWEMHDLLFQEQDRLDVRNLKIKAGRIGLDQRKFDSCLDSGSKAERVQTDLTEGTRMGVNGTPALFLNGVPLPGGAVPYETVAQAIDKELAQLARAKR